jgi:hypothetical protein
MTTNHEFIGAIRYNHIVDLSARYFATKSYPRIVKVMFVVVEFQSLMLTLDLFQTMETFLL